MAEYTKIETARAIICDFCNQLYSDEPCEPADCDWLRMLEEDAADVAPVVHGRWVTHYRSGTIVAEGYVSTCCDMWNNRKSDYCPNCGARMDGDDDAKAD